MKSTSSLLGLALILFLSACEDVPDYKNPRLPVEKRVADLVPRMTLEEKCMQLTGGDIE